MEFDFATLDAAHRYKVLASTVVPRPIAWVTSRAPDGTANAAPYSFFNVMGSNPPVVALGILARPDGTLKDTAANIVAGGAFIVHLVSEALAPAMNLTCIDAPPGVDEIALAGLATTPGTKTGLPRLVDAPVAFECVSRAAIATGPSQMLVVGEVLAAHVRDDAVLDAGRCHFATERLGLVARMHGAGWYDRAGTDMFQLDRPVWADHLLPETAS
ncbi:flavin reductase family protein [Tistrella mobilis]|uniref:flavin reductase family protein n=1 Tax=Tistrella mobilis TaxID=171437 RepID=UPI0031F6F007